MIADKIYCDGDIIFSSSLPTESPTSFFIDVGYGYGIEIPQVGESNYAGGDMAADFILANSLAANAKIEVIDGGEFASAQIVAARQIEVGEVIAADLSEDDWLANLLREKKIDKEFVAKYKVTQIKRRLIGPVTANDNHMPGSHM